MITRFWLATFEIKSKNDQVLGPIVAADTSYLAIEILRRSNEPGDAKSQEDTSDRADRWAVLFSSVDNPDVPTEATCLLGFSNAARACNTWLDRGFPLVDGAITQNAAGVVSIVSPFFTSGSAMLYDKPLLTLAGVSFGDEDGASPKVPEDLMLPYRQFFQAPDGAQPDRLVNQRRALWAPRRSNVQRLPSSQLDVKLECPSRLPSLAPFANESFRPRTIWSGQIELPEAPQDEPNWKALPPQKKQHAFGIPSFRFEDVEILGFRIDLAKLGHRLERLEPLIAPLNFHLAQHSPGSNVPIPDFRYRPATSTLVVELLRYGRMKARVPQPPMGRDDSQSQHELMIRLLVGRVDDDTAQARAPAVYVPAIFVDNPWSKVLGRDAIGYDKRMASFFIRDNNTFHRLLPDGRLPNLRPGSGSDPKPEPLGSVARISLNDGPERDGPTLLDLDFSTEDHKDSRQLQPLDLDLVFGTNAIADTRWRQGDFEDEEFRRSFARRAVADSTRSFKSLQVSPVADRGGLEQTWINGTFVLDADVRAAIPAGVATLTFHRMPSVSGTVANATREAWDILCDLLGGGSSARIALPRGSWYRLHCSMDLTIDDGLDWSGVHR